MDTYTKKWIIYSINLHYNIKLAHSQLKVSTLDRLYCLLHVLKGLHIHSPLLFGYHACVYLYTFSSLLFGFDTTYVKEDIILNMMN